MRVVCPHVVAGPGVPRGLSRLCEQALARFAPDTEMIDLGSRHDAYRVLLEELWAAGEAFLIVEQDIEIHEAVVPELEGCPEPWCLFGYNIGWPPAPVELALGCTRFSAVLLFEMPGVIAGLPVRDWRRLDCELHPVLRAAGYVPHVHHPPVFHHHRYPEPNGWGGCACGREGCDDGV